MERKIILGLESLIDPVLFAFQAISICGTGNKIIIPSLDFFYLQVARSGLLPDSWNSDSILFNNLTTWIKEYQEDIDILKNIRECDQFLQSYDASYNIASKLLEKNLAELIPSRFFMDIGKSVLMFPDYFSSRSSESLMMIEKAKDFTFWSLIGIEKNCERLGVNVEEAHNLYWKINEKIWNTVPEKYGNKKRKDVLKDFDKTSVYINDLSIVDSRYSTIGYAFSENIPICTSTQEFVNFLKSHNYDEIKRDVELNQINIALSKYPSDFQVSEIFKIMEGRIDIGLVSKIDEFYEKTFSSLSKREVDEGFLLFLINLGGSSLNPLSGILLNFVSYLYELSMTLKRRSDIESRLSKTKIYKYKEKK